MNIKSIVLSFAAVAAIGIQAATTYTATEQYVQNVVKAESNRTDVAIGALRQEVLDAMNTVDAALAGKADYEKIAYSDSWDVYEQHDGSYEFLTGLYVTTSSTGGLVRTIYGQTDDWYDHGERMQYYAYGRFWDFFVMCIQASTNEFDMAFLNSLGELDRIQSDSDPRVSGAFFTAGDYKYVYNGLSTNTVVYSDSLKSVDSIARAALARVGDVHVVSTNALTKSNNALEQVDFLSTNKADRTRHSRYGVWYMYSASGALQDTLRYSVFDGYWHGATYILRYFHEQGVWLYGDGSSLNSIPGDADAVHLDADAGISFDRDQEFVTVVYMDDTVAPSESAEVGAPAEARSVGVALAGKADKPETFIAGNLAALDADGNSVDSCISPSAKINSSSVAPAWVSGTTYATNALVTYNGVVYCNTWGGTFMSDIPPSADTNWTAKTVSELFLPLTGGQMTGNLEFSSGFGLLLPGGWVIATDPNSGVLGFARTNPAQAVVLPSGKFGTLALLSDINNLAPLESPAFTGTPTAPTPTDGDNSTNVATTAFVQSALSSISVNPLAGNEYDFSTNADVQKAVKDIVESLGGSVTNFPAIP